MVYAWQRKWILWTRFVETRVVNTHSPFPTFFVQERDWLGPDPGPPNRQGTASALCCGHHASGQRCPGGRARRRGTRPQSAASRVLCLRGLVRFQDLLPQIQKLSYAVLIAKRKLCHYFESHLVMVVTSFPLSEVIQNRDAIGRIMKWALELMGQGISYAPRTAIKS